MARHSDYNNEIADSICELIAQGRSLNSICKDEGMPAAGTVYRWLFNHEEFQDKYTRARAAQADVYAEEIIEIADNSTDDLMFLASEDSSGESGKPVIKHSAIQRARLQIDTRKWLAGKLRPKKYGEKLDMNLGGQNGENPIEQNLTVTFVKPNK